MRRDKTSLAIVHLVDLQLIQYSCSCSRFQIHARSLAFQGGSIDRTCARARLLCAYKDAHRDLRDLGWRCWRLRNLAMKLIGDVHSSSDTRELPGEGRESEYERIDLCERSALRRLISPDQRNS